MVQFLSIHFFFLYFFNFCWVFQKFPFFVSPCIWQIAAEIHENNSTFLCFSLTDYYFPFYLLFSFSLSFITYFPYSSAAPTAAVAAEPNKVPLHNSCHFKQTKMQIS